MFVCDVGDVVRLQNVFTDAATGGTVDPSEVLLYLRRPDATVGTYSYSAGDVARLAQGSYSYNGTITQTGYHTVYWRGTGAAVAAAQDRFFARGSYT